MITATPTPLLSSPAEWEAYEELPACVRDVLAHAPDPYECVSVLDQLRLARSIGFTDEQYAADLRRRVGRTR